MPKVKILAERKPISDIQIHQYEGANPDLVRLRDKYFDAQGKASDNIVEWYHMKDRVEKYLYGYFGTREFTGIGSSKRIRKSALKAIDPTYRKGLNDAFKKLDKLYEDYSSYSEKAHKLEKNFIDKTPSGYDNSFVKEGRKLKGFYKKQGIDAEVVPFYGDRDALKDSLTDLTPDDEVVLMGHAGTKMGGLPNDWLAREIKKYNPKKCSIGSCNFQKYAEPFIGANFENLTIREGEAWLGVNPYAETFEDAMYGIREGKKEAEVGEPLYREYKRVK